MRRARTLIVIGSALGVAWQVIFWLVDWLSGFHFIMPEIERHDWVADIVEAVLTNPPPYDLTVTVALTVLLGLASLVRGIDGETLRARLRSAFSAWMAKTGRAQ